MTNPEITHDEVEIANVDLRLSNDESRDPVTKRLTFTDAVLVAVVVAWASSNLGSGVSRASLAPELAPMLTVVELITAFVTAKKLGKEVLLVLD